MPSASTPLTWAEVEAAAEGEPGAVRQFPAAEMLSRIEEYGDLLDGGPELPTR